MGAATWAKTAVLLCLALAAFLASDRWFSVVDDESEFVTLARQPLSVTLDDYLYRDGQPEHPPLAGVLLHAWLPSGGQALWSVRLPSMLLYLAGLVLFALSARRLAGGVAFGALLWLGILWPFGFHFGRLADWYSAAFFLAGALTLAHLRYLERPQAPRLALFVICTVLLTYTTYYGWVIVGCLLFDHAMRAGLRASLALSAITLSVAALVYLPIGRVFGAQVLHSLGSESLANPAVLARSLNTVFGFYALFVSESVAPWFWYASLPACVAIVASLALSWSLLQPPHRRYLGYFTLLFGGMAALDILNTKRLLSISGWLLLAFALAIANTGKPAQRRLLVAALACSGAIGWAGILARDYYAAPRFVEPWQPIADEAALVVKEGGAVVTNSQSLLFHVNYSLRALGLVEASAVPGWASHAAVISVDEWSERRLEGKNGVLLAAGVNVNTSSELAAAQGWLEAHCVRGGQRRLLPDTGYALKTRYFPDAAQPAYRITLTRYACGP